MYEILMIYLIANFIRFMLYNYAQKSRFEVMHPLLWNVRVMYFWMKKYNDSTLSQLSW